MLDIAKYCPKGVEAIYTFTKSGFPHLANTQYYQI